MKTPKNLPELAQRLLQSPDILSRQQLIKHVQQHNPLLYVEYLLSSAKTEEEKKQKLAKIKEKNPQLWLHFCLTNAPNEGRHQLFLQQVKQENPELLQELFEQFQGESREKQNYWELLGEVNSASEEERPERVRALAEKLAKIGENIQGGEQLEAVLEKIKDGKLAQAVRDEVEVINPYLIRFWLLAKEAPLLEEVPDSVEKLERALASAEDEKQRQQIRDATELRDPGYKLIERYLYRQMGQDFESERVPYNELNNLGMSSERARREGKQEQAQQIIENALSKAKEYLQKFPETLVLRRIFSVLLNIAADISLAQGREEEALERFNSSLERLEEIAKRAKTLEAERDVSVSLSKVGEVLLKQGREEKALERFKSSLEIDKEIAKRAKTLEAERDVSVSLERVGDVLYAQGQREEGEESYRQALGNYQNIFQRGGGLLRNIRDTLNDAKKCIGYEDYSLAQEFLEVGRESWLRVYEVASENERFALAPLASEYGESLTYALYEDGRVRAGEEQGWEKLLVRLEQMRTRHIVELIQRREAEPDVEFLEEAVEKGEQKAKEKLALVQEAFEKFSSCRKELEEVEKEIRSVNSQVDERIKEIAYLEGREDEQSKAVLKAKRTEYERVWQKLEKSKDKRREYKQELEKQAKHVREIVPDFLPAASEMSFTEMAGLAREKEALVSFSVTPWGTMVFALTRETEKLVLGESLFWIEDFTSQRMGELLVKEKEDGYQGWLYSLMAGEASKNRHELTQLTRSLYQELFAEVEKSLRQREIKSLVFIPSGLLVLCPLHLMEIEETLTQEGVGTTYLCEKYQISYAPSFQVLSICRRRGGRGMKRVSGVANPTCDLAFASVEAEEIEQQLLSKSTIPVEFKKRQQATLANTLPLLAQEGILHFSCHGKFHFQKPLRSCLCLAPEDSAGGQSQGKSGSPHRQLRQETILNRTGERVVLVEDEQGNVVRGYFEREGEQQLFATLTLEQILAQTHFSKNALVVLSACEVGLVDMKRISEAVSFPAAFLCGGAPSVLSGLWPVNDMSTCLLMCEFYQQLAAGENKASALQKAQKAVREVTVRQLSEYVKKWSQSSSGEEPDEFMEDFWFTLRLFAVGKEQDECPFAHPFYWGAFYISGEIE